MHVPCVDLDLDLKIYIVHVVTCGRCVSFDEGQKILGLGILDQFNKSINNWYSATVKIASFSACFHPLLA